MCANFTSSLFDFKGMAMRAISLKILGALFAVLIIAGCSSTSTTDGGDSSDSSGATSSGAYSGSVEGGDVSGGDMAMASGNVIYFDFDKATIRDDALPVLMAHATRLKNSGGSAVLEGHADERGTREYNMALGERRAKAVRDYLVVQGVSRGKLEVVSYGEERPAVAESNGRAWSLNRRVVIR